MHTFGKTFAVLIILAGIGALVYFIHPLLGLLGIFALAGTKGQDEEKQKILAADPASVVAAQSPELRQRIASAEYSAVDRAMERLNSPNAPGVSVSISNPVGQ